MRQESEEDQVEFHINFTVSISTGYGSAEDFLTRYHGDVFVYDEEGVDEILVAKITVILVHDGEMSLHDVLDVDAGVYSYTALLHATEAGSFSRSVMRILGEPFVLSQDMFILDRLEVLPEFRGKGLGLRIMEICLDRLAKGSRIAVMKPFPLQFEPEARKPETDDWSQRIQLDEFTTDQKAATHKLKKYYSRLGFVPVPRTDLMILDLQKYFGET